MALIYLHCSQPIVATNKEKVTSSSNKDSTWYFFLFISFCVALVFCFDLLLKSQFFMCAFLISSFLIAVVMLWKLYVLYDQVKKGEVLQEYYKITIKITIKNCIFFQTCSGKKAVIRLIIIEGSIILLALIFGIFAFCCWQLFGGSELCRKSSIFLTFSGVYLLAIICFSLNHLSSNDITLSMGKRLIDLKRRNYYSIVALNCLNFLSVFVMTRGNRRRGCEPRPWRPESRLHYSVWNCAKELAGGG